MKRLLVAGSLSVVMAACVGGDGSVTGGGALTPNSTEDYSSLNDTSPPHLMEVGGRMVGVSEKGMKPAESKISPHLRAVLAEAKTKGPVPRPLTEDEIRALSSPLVKVNARGEVQVYVEVESITPALSDRLKQKGMAIEITNAELRLIQGWIPLHMLEDISLLPEVKRVRPPDYGITQP